MSVILTAAVRLPLEVGVKVTLIVQLAPVATELPQVFVSAKSEPLVPEIAMLEIVRPALPRLVSVTACGLLVVVTGWLAKVKLAGDTLTVPAAIVPVPLRVIV